MKFAQYFSNFGQWRIHTSFGALHFSLEPGAEMLLNFFLQEPGSDTQRSNVSLACAVTQCHDEAKLIYSVRVTKLEDKSRDAIQRYTASCAGGAAR